MVASFKAAGREFSVNSYTKNVQADPSIDANPVTGGFQIVWESMGQDGDGLGVFGQEFGAKGGKSGSEFMINTVIEGDQENVDVAFNEDGAGAWTFLTKSIWFVTVDVDDTPISAGVADNYRTRSKTFGFDGEGYNNEERLRFGLTREGKEQEATEIRVISLGGDKFATSTPIFETAVGYGGIDIDEFAATDSPIRGGQWSRRTVNDDRFPLGQTTHGDLVVQKDGTIIAISSMASDINGSDGVIQFEEFFQPSSQGLAFKVGTRTVLDESSGLTGPATDPRAALLKNGTIAITWSELNQTSDSDHSDVYVQIVKGDGTIKSPAILVHGVSAKDQDQAEVTALKDGGFMVSWTDHSGKSGSKIMAQRFDSTGIKMGKAQIVGQSNEGDVADSALATLKGGKVAITWESDSADDNKGGIAARLFKAGAYGNKKAQELTGTSKNEKFSTGAKNDTIDGGDGNDVIDGGADDDILTGGLGKDRFIFNGGHDTILDFEDNVDTVVFAKSLGAGGLTKTKLGKIVEEKAKALVFDFGDDSLTIKGINSFDDLKDDLGFL